MATDRKSWGFLLAFGVCVGATAVIVGQESSRRVQVGDVMAPFSLKDGDGKTYAYGPQQKRTLVVLFAAPGQRQSEQAMAELRELVSEVARDDRPLDLVVIVSGAPPAIQGEEEKSDADRSPQSGSSPRVVFDRDWSLWGKLGLVASPTALLVGRDGKVDWIAAGYSYEFRKTARTKIAETLGVPRNEPTQVDPVDAATAADRDRGLSHLKMGLLLAEKGRAEAAISELKKAEALLPGSPQPLLARAEILCQLGRSEDALAEVSRAKPTDEAEKARAEQILGWANRQLGNHADAETHLVNSLRLNGNSVRALYELGKLYEELGDTKRAMETYRRALVVQFKETTSPEKRKALESGGVELEK